MKRAIALLILLLAACRDEPVSTGAPPPSSVPHEVVATDPKERANLLDMARGASIVSRTAELTLESSAVQLIDGDLATAWASPPSDTNQSIVLGLAAPARVESIGVRTAVADTSRVNNLTVEWSLDGRNFKLLAEPALSRSAETQTFEVDPVNTRYLRVTVTGAAGTLPTIHSIQGHGRFLSTPKAQPIAGCWSINELQSHFVTSGASVRGVADEIRFEGSAEGPLYRFAWMRGPDFGVGAFTVSADGNHVSGIRWFERASAKNYGGSWMGDRQECLTRAVPAVDIAARFIDRVRRYPVYGLTFNDQDQLVESESLSSLTLIERLLRTSAGRSLHVVSREFRETSAEANRRKAQRRLDSVRSALMKRGNDVLRIQFSVTSSVDEAEMLRTELMRAMNSGIEVRVP